MGSVITLRSRWKDKEWEPEDGSPLGRPYSYTLDGVKHYVSKEEVEAGERVGTGTYLDYAAGSDIAPPGRGGWELFDDRPGRKDLPPPDRSTKRWTKGEDERLRGLLYMGLSYRQAGEILYRSSMAVRLRARKL